MANENIPGIKLDGSYCSEHCLRYRQQQDYFIFLPYVCSIQDIVSALSSIVGQRLQLLKFRFT